jgi:NAD(P)H-flavin reductase
LFHGSRNLNGLYFVEEMRGLTERYGNFYYTPCISGQDSESDLARGRVHELALSSIETLSGWRVYLCGHPEMVNQTKRMAFMKGASMGDIYTDAFLVAQEKK